MSDDIPAPATAESLLDSWLLQHFPGRFLDELETEMDIFRFLRALKARNVEGIETLRQRFRERKIKADDITPEQWEDIRRHDQIMDELTRD